MSLRIDLNGSESGFSQMLNRARAQARAFSNSVTHEASASWNNLGKSFLTGMVGMLSVEGVKGMIQGVIGKVNELRQLSEQLGTDDVVKIQKWGKAFEKVGSDIGKATMITGQMQGLRQSAMGHDLAAMKTRQQLEGMGFSMREINPESGLDSLDFMKKAFHFANQGRGNASQFEELFGPKSARFAGAEKYVDGAEARIDQDTFQQLKDTANALHEFGEAVGGLTSQFFKYALLMTGFDVVGWARARDSKSDAMKTESELHNKIGKLRDKVINGVATQFEKDWLISASKDVARKNGKSVSQATIDWIQQQPTAKDDFKPNTKAATPPEEDQDVKNQREGWQKEEQDAQMGLHRAQEGNLTIGDPRRMIGQDIALVQSQIAATQGKLGSKTLGLSDESFGKMTDIEKEEMRHKLRMELTEEMTKESGLTDELKQNPTTWQGDSGAKTGLFSGVSLAFNPVVAQAQQTNRLLMQIVSNTTPPKMPPKDPHAP